ncbi:MAG: GGDEF domain-containing protein [Terracidiphilus sp.]|jgi:diguanylate cyclase (GGDEF)-like protein
MLDWSRIPNVVTIALLLCAFASLERHFHSPASRLWFLGWLMVLLHFIAAIFQNIPGIWGQLAFVAQVALFAGAGFLYMYAAIPDRKQPSYRCMLASLMVTSTLYISVVRLAPDAHLMLSVAAALLGLSPLTVMLVSARRVNHPLRGVVVLIYGALSIFLLSLQNQPGNVPGTNPEIPRHAIMFAVYFCCFIFVFYTYRRATAGAFITIAGFFCWAMSFVVTPLIMIYLPRIQIEKEVWDLPKFVVAVGMLLILLEDQIEHNKHLALHDELTGLPNRRLFQDRILSALDRARRTNTQAALLVIDLDHFKKVNDTFGHHVGDLLLQKVGSIFTGRVRRSDTVARTGGDEFSVILEEPTSRADAMHVCEALLDLLKEPLLLDDYMVQTGASIGLAVFPEDATDMESMCIVADQRMYEEKRRLATRSGQQTARIANLLPQ